MRACLARDDRALLAADVVEHGALGKQAVALLRVRHRRRRLRAQRRAVRLRGCQLSIQLLRAALRWEAAGAAQTRRRVSGQRGARGRERNPGLATR
jgi:hypothetical protein